MPDFLQTSQSWYWWWTSPPKKSRDWLGKGHVHQKVRKKSHCQKRRFSIFDNKMINSLYQYLPKFIHTCHMTQLVIICHNLLDILLLGWEIGKKLTFCYRMSSEQPKSSIEVNFFGKSWWKQLSSHFHNSYKGLLLFS